MIAGLPAWCKPAGSSVSVKTNRKSPLAARYRATHTPFTINAGRSFSTRDLAMPIDNDRARAAVAVRLDGPPSGVGPAPPILGAWAGVALR